MKHQKEGSLLLGLIALLTVVVVVAVVGLVALRPEKMLIQGEAEAAEYRVSGKVPGRIEMYFFEEGEHKVPRHPGLPQEEHRGFPAPLPLSPFYPPVRASGSYQEGTGKSGSFGMWNHPRGHVWNVVVRPASS